MKENKIYGPGSVFYDFLVNTYYEIVSGKVIKEYFHGCSYLYRTIHKKITVQQLKFVKNKIEYVPIDNFKNREFYEEDHYILVKDDDVKPCLYKNDIDSDDFFKKNSIKKIVSRKGKKKEIEIIREQDK